MSGSTRVFVDDFGVELRNVHRQGASCARYGCAVHAPSTHPMREWPLQWRGALQPMERVCRHGVGHPDPDDLAFRTRTAPFVMHPHSCDGCCSSTYDPESGHHLLFVEHAEARTRNHDATCEIHSAMGGLVVVEAGWAAIAGDWRLGELQAAQKPTAAMLAEPLQVTYTTPASRTSATLTWAPLR